MNGTQISNRAAQMRRDFDLAFAQAPRERQHASTDLLTIGLHGDPYALPMAAVAGLFAGKKITRLPCAAPEFLGIAGVRGSLVPVYDLRVLMGYAGGDAPRWLIVVAANSVALAFDSLHGCLRLATQRIARQHGDAVRPHTHEVARVADARSMDGTEVLRPVVDLASVVAAIERLARLDICAPITDPQE